MPLVVTITEKFVVEPLAMVTLGALHAAAVGAPEHAKFSVPLKPAPGEACIMKVAGCPALTEALAPDCATKVAAATAVPLMVTDCGDPAALSANTRLVVRTPAASGEKITPTEHDAFVANELAQVFELMEKSAVFTPLSMGADEKVRVAFPELVMVMDCAALDSPCVVVPGNVSVPGISVTCGAGGGGATAVPVSETFCGLPAALSEMTSVAWVTPVAEGI